MFSFFRKKIPVCVSRPIGEILVNDEGAEEKYGVLDFTKTPIDLILNIKENLKWKNKEEMDRIIVKICGKISGLSLKLSQADYGESKFDNLQYDGFIVIGEEYPVYFSCIRYKAQAPDLKLERTVLETGRDLPITMTARLIFTPENNKPYGLYPFVLQLGDYISPPRRKK